MIFAPWRREHFVVAGLIEVIVRVKNCLHLRGAGDGLGRAAVHQHQTFTDGESHDICAAAIQNGDLVGEMANTLLPKIRARPTSPALQPQRSSTDLDDSYLDSCDYAGAVAEMVAFQPHLLQQSQVEIRDRRTFRQQQMLAAPASSCRSRRQPECSARDNCCAGRCCSCSTRT